MPPKTLIQTSGGVFKEVFNTVADVGPAGDGLTVGLDGTGRVHETLWPAFKDSNMVIASEALTAGDFVNIWDDLGIPKVRKATASNVQRPAHGFVLDTVIAGDTVEVLAEGTNPALSGLTPKDYYLSCTVPGGVQGNSPFDLNQISQKVGKAVSPTSINFHPGIIVITDPGVT